RVGQAPEGTDREPFHAGVPEPNRAQVTNPHHQEPPVAHDSFETKPARTPSRKLKMSTGGSVGLLRSTRARPHAASPLKLYRPESLRSTKDVPPPANVCSLLTTDVSCRLPGFGSRGAGNPWESDLS